MELPYRTRLQLRFAAKFHAVQDALAFQIVLKRDSLA